jgi:hypothetical protein
MTARGLAAALERLRRGLDTAADLAFGTEDQARHVHERVERLCDDVRRTRLELAAALAAGRPSPPDPLTRGPAEGLGVYCCRLEALDDAALTEDQLRLRGELLAALYRTLDQDREA